MSGELRFVDEHAADIDAPAPVVWGALVATLRPRESAVRSAGARLLGCRETVVTGAFPAEGATLPGFRVAASSPPSLLTLEGRHRFSSYALVFRVEDGRLRAETRAAFPGVAGSLYRTAVIGTRGHVVVVRRLLASVKRRAESG